MYQRQAVAQRQDDFLHALVAGHKVIELKDSGRLSIERLAVIDHLAVPKRIVGNDEAAGSDVVKHQVVIFQILTLVGIDKHQVERQAELRNDFTRVCLCDGRH